MKVNKQPKYLSTHVINMSDRFTLDVGVYEPNVFQYAEMNINLSSPRK